MGRIARRLIAALLLAVAAAPAGATDWAWNGLRWGMTQGDAMEALAAARRAYPQQFVEQADPSADHGAGWGDPRYSGYRLAVPNCSLNILLAIEDPAPPPKATGLIEIALTPPMATYLSDAGQQPCLRTLIVLLTARYGAADLAGASAMQWFRPGVTVELSHPKGEPLTLTYQTTRGLPDLF
ncbi:MAG: hypothetical protein RIB84_23785 [Sneathiellaceae bacterium]